MILLTITHIARHGNDFTVKVCPFFFHIEIEIDAHRLACFHSKSLLHRQHHLFRLRIKQTHPHSTIQILFALIDDGRCHHRIVTPTHETWHVRSEHEFFACLRFCTKHSIIHILRMCKAHELPFSQ